MGRGRAGRRGSREQDANINGALCRHHDEHFASMNPCYLHTSLFCGHWHNPHSVWRWGNQDAECLIPGFQAYHAVWLHVLHWEVIVMVKHQVTQWRLVSIWDCGKSACMCDGGWGVFWNKSNKIYWWNSKSMTREGKGENWRRKWQPTPVSLPGESHGQRSLAGGSLWGRKSRTRLSD